MQSDVSAAEPESNRVLLLAGPPICGATGKVSTVSPYKDFFKAQFYPAYGCLMRTGHDFKLKYINPYIKEHRCILSLKCRSRGTFLFNSANFVSI